jgi:hypothetical protein
MKMKKAYREKGMDSTVQREKKKMNTAREGME